MLRYCGDVLGGVEPPRAAMPPSSPGWRGSPLNQKRLCLDLVHEDEWELDEIFRILSHRRPLRAGFAERTLARQALSQELTEDATMPRVKQASKQKRTTKAAAVKVLGAAGLGLSLVGSASASTMPTADIPQSDNTSPNQRFVLGEEEMADVSLATFHLFDRENVGSGVQLARGCGGCGGCRGCGGGCRGCGGCAVAAADSVAAGSVAAWVVWVVWVAWVARAAAYPGERAACAKSHDLTAGLTRTLPSWASNRSASRWLRR